MNGLSSVAVRTTDVLVSGSTADCQRVRSRSGLVSTSYRFVSTENSPSVHVSQNTSDVRGAENGSDLPQYCSLLHVLLETSEAGGSTSWTTFRERGKHLIGTKFSSRHGPLGNVGNCCPSVLGHRNTSKTTDRKQKVLSRLIFLSEAKLIIQIEVKL